MIRETDTDRTRPMSMSWCQIGLHHIFASAGEASMGRLQRQLISYHLLISNLTVAQKSLEQMTFMQKNNRSSRYLAYCVAIRSGNEDDAHIEETERPRKATSAGEWGSIAFSPSSTCIVASWNMVARSVPTLDSIARTLRVELCGSGPG